MELNEIKKTLYKGDYVAKFDYVKKGTIYYECKPLLIRFAIPIDDIGDASMLPNMPAKLLIRWIIQ